MLPPANYDGWQYLFCNYMCELALSKLIYGRKRLYKIVCTIVSYNKKSYLCTAF